MARHELYIPDWHPASVNKLLRGWWQCSSAKKHDAKCILVYARIHNIPFALGRRKVSAVFSFGPRKRRFDTDNLLKSLFDGLQQAKLIINDSPRWLEHGCFECIKGEYSGTLIVLEDVDVES